MRTRLWLIGLLLLPAFVGCGGGGGGGPGQNPDGKDTGPGITFNKSGPGPMKGPGDNAGVKVPKGLGGK